MKKITIIFSAANLLVMLIFVASVLSARNLAIAEERDFYDSGDGINFTSVILPMLLLCLASNIVWVIMAVVAMLRRQHYASAVASFSVVVLWAIAIPLIRKMGDLPPWKASAPAAGAWR